MAGLAGSVAGWLVGDSLRPYLGVVGSGVVSLLVVAAVFVRVRKWLRELRNG